MTGDQETIRFAGRTWRVKTSSTPIGPGPNPFSADRVRVDVAGHLRLGIDSGPAGWDCAEVIADGGFGYGRYRWSVASDLRSLDAHAVLGMFLWADDPAQANREVDIEFSCWGRAAPPPSGSFTVQNAAPPSSFRFAAPSGRSDHTLIWTPGRVAFRSRFGSVVHHWITEAPGVPAPGGGVAPRINLWLFRGTAPAGQQSVTVENFTYDPTPPRQSWE